MFNILINAQGIWVVVNTKTSYFVLISPSVPYPTTAVGTLAHVFEVDLMDYVATLIAEEPTMPPASTKRGRDEKQQSPRMSFSETDSCH